jgi:hypothetical protein
VSGSDSEKIDLILKRLEEMNASIAKMQDELKTVSASLKSLAVGQITKPPTVHVTTSAPKPPVTVFTPKPATTAAPPPVESSKTRSLTDVKMSFPEDLEARLAFEEKGEYIIIKPKSFLGSDNFAKIALTIRGMGGEYISAGKDSHFRVPKKKA